MYTGIFGVLGVICACVFGAQINTGSLGLDIVICILGGFMIGFSFTSFGMYLDGQKN